jgi:hypothetical protein
MLRARIARDIEIGKLPGTADSEALAHMVIAVIQGMSVLARDGIDRAGLCSLVDTILAGWPSRPSPS